MGSVSWELRLFVRKNIVLLEILYDFFEEILLIGSKFYFIQTPLSISDISWTFNSFLKQHNFR